MRIAVLAGLVTLVASAQLKRTPGAYENDRISVESVLLLDRTQVKALLGSDFDGSVAVIEVTVVPRGGEALDVEREDWTLFSNKDAQKAPAFHPSQLAGQGALLLTQKGAASAVMGRNNPNGPIIGGIPGTGGRPRQINDGGGGIGNTASVVTENKVEEASDSKENPVLKTLKSKELVYGKTLKPVKGLLYFSLDGKHKPKDIELWYRGPAGKFVVSYKPQ
ncbi:MAG: hypothetical protein FJW30_07440 [Acidobacteria bacterium]|nr:hypothetical protein [Acidobacteriota bacterium]